MKFKILKVLVLLVSISAASVLIWNATRDKEPKETRKDGVISPEAMLGSSKSKVAGVQFVELEQETFVYEVTNEEVKRTRDMMLSTSKSGKIMSDDKIREILEDKKKEELKLKKEQKLMPSSKSIDAILSRRDVEKIIEDRKSESQQESNLIPSSKNPSRLLDPEDVEKMMERGASDFVKPQEPEK